MQMDLGSLFALGLFIAIEGLVLFYLKKILKSLKAINKPSLIRLPKKELSCFSIPKKTKKP